MAAHDFTTSAPEVLTDSAPARISTGTVGAISELLVSADLMRRNVHVFRALSANCPCDLVAMHDGKLYRVEVTRGHLSLSGAIKWASHDPKNYDVIACVTQAGEIYYVPDVFPPQLPPPPSKITIPRREHAEFKKATPATRGIFSALDAGRHQRSRVARATGNGLYSRLPGYKIAVSGDSYIISYVVVGAYNLGVIRRAIAGYSASLQEAGYIATVDNKKLVVVVAK